MEKKRKLASFKIPRQTTILDFKRKRGLLNSGKDVSVVQEVTQSESPLSPVLLAQDIARDVSTELPKLEPELEPSEIHIDEFQDEIRKRYNLDHRIQVWPKYSKHKDRYVVERVHKKRKIMLESIPIHRNLERTFGYAQWTLSAENFTLDHTQIEENFTLGHSEQAVPLNDNSSVKPVISPQPLDLPSIGHTRPIISNIMISDTESHQEDSDTETIDLTIMDPTVDYHKPDTFHDTNLFFSEELDLEQEVTNLFVSPKPRKPSLSHLFDSPKSPFVGNENRLRSDPVSLILDELCQDDDFPQHDEMDQEDFGGPDEVYGNENDYPVEYPLDHQYEKEQYPIDHQPKDVHYRYEDDIHDEDLFESVPSKKHIPSSPIVIEDTSTSIKRKLKKALFPSNTIHSSPRDTFRGYGIGSTLKNPQPPSEVLEIFSDYDISQESDTFVNLQKARENGDTAGLENYFNQFDAAPVRKRKQKESVPKAKKPWKGKNYQYKRYKRKK